MIETLKGFTVSLCSNKKQAQRSSNCSLFRFVQTFWN